MDPWLLVAIIISSLSFIGIVLFVVALIIKKKASKEEKRDPEKEMISAFEEIPPLSEEDESKLVEIKDKELIKRINNSVPGALKAVAGADISSAIGEVAGSPSVFQAILPAGAALNKGETVASNATLLSASAADKFSRVTALSTANAIMGVASMIVGQYYLSMVDNKLKDMSASIEKITAFQQNEFRSKVYALVAEAQKISTFQVETMENHELRDRELNHLRSLEHECVELLGQANLSLQEIALKQGLDFKAYDKATEDSEGWYQYQQILLRIIKEIADLTYALNLGAITKENSSALCVPYIQQSEETNLKLKGWHEENVKRLNINLEESKVKRSGVKGLLMKPLSLFNDKLNYKEMSKGTVERIEHQSGLSSHPDAVESDLYKEDVTLIAKDGKYYFLPKK